MIIMNGTTKQRILRATAVLTAGTMLTAGAVFLPEKNAVLADNAGVVVAKDGVAGVSASLHAMQTATVSSDTEQTTTEVVATSNETSTATSALYPDWANKLMANVEDSVNVRETASTDGVIAGKLRKGDVADIVATQDGWYQITSGNLTGYVSQDYAVTGDAAKALADQVCATTATVNASALKLRQEANETATILTTLYQNESVTVRTDALQVDGWVAVTKNGKDGYLSASYVTVQKNYGTGITAQEEAAAIAAQKKAEEEAAKKAAEAAAKKAAKSKTTTNSSSSSNADTSYAASYDDATLLAAIIQHEAGNEIYTGQVAVGAAVMNRVKSGRYPSSVRGVLFQRGQFTSEAELNRVIARGLKSSCIQAAQEALAGSDPIDGCVSFRPVRSGRSGIVIGNHVFF